MGVKVEEETHLAEKPCLIYIRYLDHVEFKHSDPGLFKPCVREVVGWLVRETDEALCLTYDRSVEPFSARARAVGETDD